jgi:hypothetical protein
LSDLKKSISDKDFKILDLERTLQEKQKEYQDSKFKLLEALKQPAQQTQAQTQAKEAIINRLNLQLLNNTLV